MAVSILCSTSAESRPDGELGGRNEFGRVDLLAALRLHAGHSDAAVGADYGETVGVHDDDLAHLAADAFRILGGKRFGFENLERLSLEHRPGARGGIAAADQAVDLDPRLASRSSRCPGRSGLHRSLSTHPA